MFTADTEAQHPLNRRPNITPGRSFLENSIESFKLPTVSTDNFFISKFLKKSLSPNSVEEVGQGSPESQSYCDYSRSWVIYVPPKSLGWGELCLRRTKKNTICEQYTFQTGEIFCFGCSVFSVVKDKRRWR